MAQEIRWKVCSFPLSSIIFYSVSLSDIFLSKFYFSATPNSTPNKKTNSTSSLSVPNLIDDDMNDQSQNTPILRNSVLESSFRHSRAPSFRRSNSQQGVTRASTFKIIGKIGGIGVPLPESSDVPEGYNVHLLEIPLKKGENLGLSLVPATNELKNYLQVLRL